ncbi:hypothetical protein CEXT_624691 [Caerostris extrusa]|uniref:Uncharacterized protein n=1 Tax=Caerostris extrusa TaxID=172846 RepID=A0AAV4TVV2_CAEEX|nr:hypothetical protein CEXT_624691 [Caerostris extrusa]
MDEPFNAFIDKNFGVLFLSTSASKFMIHKTFKCSTHSTDKSERRYIRKKGVSDEKIYMHPNVYHSFASLLLAVLSSVRCLLLCPSLNIPIYYYICLMAE